MSTVFIIGGTGKVGRRLIPLLIQHHTVHALHRASEQAAALTKLGAVPMQGDLTVLDSHQLADLMKGCDIVIFSAGAGGKGGPSSTDSIDGQGLVSSAEAAQRAGIDRFLLVSAFPEALRSGGSPDFEHYMYVKKQTEAYLVQTELAWIILRPGTLNDNPGAGLVSAEAALSYGEIPREDVAAMLSALVDNPQIKRTIIELTEGDTPITTAVQRLEGAERAKA